MIPLLLLVAIGGLMQAARSFITAGSASAAELAFGFLLLTAYFGGKLVSRIGLPKLTGYLLAGVIGGPFVLELVTREMTDSLKIVNGVATCILGLTAGAELNLKRIKPMMATLRGILVFGVLGGVAALAGVLFLLRSILPMFDGMSMPATIAVCVLFAVTLIPQSPSVVMAILSETRADGPLSQICLAAVVVSDLAIVVCYAIAAAVTGGMIGGGVDTVALVIEVSWELIGSIVFGIAIGMLIGQFVRSVPRGAAMFALLVCVVVAQLASRVQLDPLIVTLASGIWLENFSRADASALLEGFESAQLPVFLVWFALSGTLLDIAQLWAGIVPVLILAAARAGWFVLGTRVACAITGAPRAVARSSWVGLVPQAGLSLAFIVTVRVNFPTFGGDIAVMILSLLGVNLLVSPVLLRGALIRSGEVGKKQAADFAAH